jgi:hypothetical protein
MPATPGSSPNSAGASGGAHLSQIDPPIPLCRIAVGYAVVPGRDAPYPVKARRRKPPIKELCHGLGRSLRCRSLRDRVGDRA